MISSKIEKLSQYIFNLLKTNTKNWMPTRYMKN